MPKRVQEIKHFHTGMISSPEEADIPLDASPNSLNIEPVNVGGRLEGIPEDVTKKAGVNARVMKKVNDEGTYHVIYYDNTAKRIKQISDLYGAANITDLSGSDETSVTRPCMEVYNKEVHIGTGSSNKPRWVGFIEHDQFDSTAPSTMQIDNAELVSPTAFTDIYKFVEKSGFIYGIEWQGTRIYKFKLSDKSFVGKSEAVLNSSQGICLSGDESHLWVMDYENTNMKIMKIDLDEMQAEFENTLTSTSSLALSLSDMIVVGSNLWVSKHGEHSANVLYTTAENTITADGTISLTDKTPNATDSAAAQEWKEKPSEIYIDVNVKYVIPKVALCSVGGTTRVGMLSEILNNTNAGADVWYQHGTSSNRIKVRHIIHVISTSQSTSNGPERIFRIDTSNDFISSQLAYGISTKAGASGMVMYGNSTFTGDTTFKLLGSTLNGDGITDRYDDIALNAGADLEVETAYGAVHNSDSNISVFEGSGTGRWLHGSAIGSMTAALETNVRITCRSTVADYGEGSTTHNAKIGFKDTSTQFYKISYMFDGFQESPLSDEFSFQGVSANGKGVKVTIELRNIANLSRRISHIQLYRADADNRNAYVEPNGFYRLVKKIKLDTSWSLIDTGSGSPWADYRKKVITDKNEASASFDARTGISELLEDITPSYTLSTQLNNTHFIADIKQTTLGALSNYILKSKPLRFDQFNYVADFLALPSKPTAIIGYNGRLYAFDENNTYRIEPNNFYIEDIYEGIGCLGPEAIIVTEFGLFFADQSNIYMHDGRKPRAIGSNIKRGDTSIATGAIYRTDKHYDNVIKNTYLRMGFDGTRGCLLVFVKFVSLTDSVNYYCWAYTIAKNRWDLWDVGTAKPKSIISGKDGEVYFSNETDLKHHLGGTNKRTWSWSSKEMTGGADSVDKRFIEVYVGGIPTSSPTIYIDGSSVTATVTESNKKNVIPASNRSGKKLRVSLASQTSSVDSIGFIYRPLVVSDGNI